MSRCFAYPPPGFSVSRGSGPALIESIKLQRGSELANEETKNERKRDHKVRGKEKKETLKGCLLPEKKVLKRSSSGPKIRSLQKLIQSENEQLERSSLTEELEQPVGEQKPSTSSDSTENSSKRKREASAPSAVRQEEHSKPSNGNVIRIRLPVQKRNAVASKQEPCSITPKRAELPSHEQTTSRRTELPSHEQATTRGTELISHERIPSRRIELPSPEQQVTRISREQPCSTSGRSCLATSKTRLGSQDNVPSVQQGHNNVLFARPPRREVNKVCPALVPSVNRLDNPAFTSQMPKDKLPEGALTHKNVSYLRPPRREANKVSCASGPSVNREDSGAFISQMPKNKLPGAAVPPRPEEKICSPLGVRKAITHNDDIAVHETKSLVKKMVEADVSPLGIPKAITRKVDIAVRDPKSLDKKMVKADVSPLGIPKAITRNNDIAVRDPKSLDKRMVKADLRYRDLFLNLVPPPPQTELQSDDQDWLLSKKKNPDNQCAKKLRQSNLVSRCNNSSLWPHAQFIPEADVYALPFTVPF